MMNNCLRIRWCVDCFINVANVAHFNWRRLIHDMDERDWMGHKRSISMATMASQITWQKWFRLVLRPKLKEKPSTSCRTAALESAEHQLFVVLWHS